MAELLMYDSVTVADLPDGGYAYAGYLDGDFTTWQELVARFLSSGAHLLSVTVNAENWAMCHSIDDEPGDEDNAQAAQYALVRLKLNIPPVIYTSASNLLALYSALADVGVKRSQVLIWSAHYTNKQHFCALHSCGYGSGTPADATQFATTDAYDTSVVSPEFFASWATPAKTVPEVAWKAWTTAGELSLLALAKQQKTTVTQVIEHTIVASGGNLSLRFAEYLNAGDLNAVMPAGFILTVPVTS